MIIQIGLRPYYRQHRQGDEMKKIDLATITTNDLRAIKGLYPEQQSIYRIARWNMASCKWVLYSRDFESEAAAENFGDKDTVKGFSHYCVVTINLPGAKL